MATLSIVLQRKDLTKDKKDLPSDEITFNDFKQSSVTLDEIHRATFIYFIDDDGELYILKSRY